MGEERRLKIQADDILEHLKIFSSAHQKIVKLQQHSEFKGEWKFYRVLLRSGHIVPEIEWDQKKTLPMNRRPKNIEGLSFYNV